MTEEHFEQICKIIYKDYGKNNTYQQSVNTKKYNKKVQKVLELLDKEGYLK